MASRKKFCDLNVIVSTSKEQNINNVKRLVSYGYKVIAINHIHEAADRNTGNMSSRSFIEYAKKLNKDILNELKSISDKNENDFHLPDDVVLLTRATFPLTKHEDIVLFRKPYYKAIFQNFDLIAFEPENEKMLKLIQENKFNVDIIALPLEIRNSFEVSRNRLNSCADMNIKFEFPYSTAIKSLALRKTIFYNAVKIINKFKKQKSIIITSGGESYLDFRSPSDVINFSSLFEIQDKNSQSVVSTNPLQAVLHGQIRSKTFCGGVTVEKDRSTSDSLAEEPAAKRSKVE